VEVSEFSGIELLAGELKIEAATAAAVVVIYLLQTLLSFTLLAQHNGMFLNDDDKPPPGPVGYLFTIWGYVSTIGSAYAPRNVLSTIIAMSAGAYSLLLLGVFLAYAIRSLQNRFSGGNQPAIIAPGFEIIKDQAGKFRVSPQGGRRRDHRRQPGLREQGKCP
jgi:hypothetical protein